MVPEHKECYKIDAPKRIRLKDALKLPHVMYMVFLYFLIFLAFNFYYVSFPVYAAKRLGWSTLQLGVFFSILSGALVLVQGPVLSSLSKKFTSTQLVTAGSILLAAAFPFFRSADLIVLYSGLMLFALGNGIMWPSFLTILSNTADDNYQGTVQGIASSAGSLASIIGLLAGAFTYKMAGNNTFLLVSALMLCITAASFKLKRVEKSQ
jgi:MFS family permease